MPTVVKRGENYLVRVRKDGFPPVSKTFIRKADAVAWGRRVEADMQGGRYVDEGRAVPTLATAIEEYRQRVAPTLKGERDYRYAFREIEATPLASFRLDKVKPAHLADWRDQLLSRGLKNATVVRRLGLLSSVLTWAWKERGWLRENPMHAVRKPVVRDARTRTLDEEEVRYLEIATRSARAKWLPDAVTLLITSAMRRSELVALKCRDVDMDLSVARLHDSKNGEAREVPLSPDAKAAMGRLIVSASAANCEAVLPITDPEAISFAFRRAVMRGQQRYLEDCAAQGRTPVAGFLDGVRLHDLRHHAITSWAKTGALSVLELQRISGHKSLKMLARYTHLTAASLAQRMAAIDRSTVGTLAA